MLRKSVTEITDFDELFHLFFASKLCADRRYNHAMSNRDFQLADRLVGRADNLLRTVFAPRAGGTRPSPSRGIAKARLSDDERKRAARLMRVNQSGEVAAQGLYQGHGFAARDASLREKMNHAANEERDHLNWCTERLEELNARPSVLNGAWYAGAFALGALSGIAGDRWGLGFIAETERQVAAHLSGHLEKLPRADARSREIVKTMRDEEAAHGREAASGGAAELPGPVKRLMGHAAKIMTKTAYWI